jgi:PAS domain S-box-containing protein
MQKILAKLGLISPWITFCVGFVLTAYGWYATNSYFNYLISCFDAQLPFDATAHAAYIPWIVLLLGTLLNVLVTGLVYLASRTRRAAQAMAAGMIQKQQAQEAELRKLALVASRTHNAVIITDAQGYIEWVNDAFTRYTGYGLEEVKGKRTSSLITGPETDRVLLDHIRQEMLSGKQFTGELQSYDKWGKPSWSSIEVQPILDESGCITNIVIIHTDITERKNVEGELREYAQALEEANRSLEEYTLTVQNATKAKTECLAQLSHEIRTPLTAILGFAEVLRTEGDLSKAPPARIEAIDTVIRNSEYLLRLINDLLDLSKIEAGKFDVERVSCSSLELIHEVEDLINIRASDKKISFGVEFDGPLPEHVSTDPIRLQQILINLLGNAVKFTETGGVRLRVRLDTEDADNPNLEFSVIDTGMGMSEDQLKRIFEPYVQADRSITQRYGGTGLGLAVSRKLACLLGGSISVESSLGRGSTFRLLLPVGSLAGVGMIQSPAEAANSLPKIRHDLYDTADDKKLKGRILLAEDGPDNQRLIVHILQKAGAEIIAVDNGKAALDEALRAWRQENPFDLILMDMQMPIMDGCAAVRHLRAMGYSNPIIALTAHAMDEARRQCLAAGCDDYAAKPINRHALLSLAAQYLTQSPAVESKA